jgi:hypothetical protein
VSNLKGVQRWHWWITCVILKTNGYCFVFETKELWSCYRFSYHFKGRLQILHHIFENFSLTVQVQETVQHEVLCQVSRNMVHCPHKTWMTLVTQHFNPHLNCWLTWSLCAHIFLNASFLNSRNLSFHHSKGSQHYRRCSHSHHINVVTRKARTP